MPSTITAHGITWTCISRNERSCSHEGRHFFACRCRPGSPWRVDEISSAKIKGSRTIRVIANGLSIFELSAAVRGAFQP